MTAELAGSMSVTSRESEVVAGRRRERPGTQGWGRQARSCLGIGARRAAPAGRAPALLTAPGLLTRVSAQHRSPPTTEDVKVTGSR